MMNSYQRRVVRKTPRSVSWRHEGSPDLSPPSSFSGLTMWMSRERGERGRAKEREIEKKCQQERNAHNTELEPRHASTHLPPPPFSRASRHNAASGNKNRPTRHWQGTLERRARLRPFEAQIGAKLLPHMYLSNSLKERSHSVAERRQSRDVPGLAFVFGFARGIVTSGVCSVLARQMCPAALRPTWPIPLPTEAAL